MAKNQRSYTQEFKQQIVDLHNQAGKGISELSCEYGIPKGTISTWIKNLSPVKVSETETISIKEYKALQKKMKELEIESTRVYHRQHSRFASESAYVTYAGIMLELSK